MELANIIYELWRRKLWLAFAFIVALAATIPMIFKVQLSPPALKTKSFQVGSASTQLLVDSGRAPLVNTGFDLAPLVARAAVFAPLMASKPVVQRIAQVTRISPDQIAATGPAVGQPPRAANEPLARLDQLRTEGTDYRLLFQAQVDQPVVSVFAQAPTPELAARLANGSVTALRVFVEEQQRIHQVPGPRQTLIRQLGGARSGIVTSEGAKPALAVLTFLLVFVVLCAASLLFSGFRRNLRAARAARPERSERGAPAVREDELPLVNERDNEDVPAHAGAQRLDGDS